MEEAERVPLSGKVNCKNCNYFLELIFSMLNLKDLDGIGAQGFSICKRKGSRKNGLGGRGGSLWGSPLGPSRKQM